MAEFCLDCLNKMNKTNYTEKDYVLSEDLDFCEGCGEFKRVVIKRRGYYDGGYLVNNFILFDLLEALVNGIISLIKKIYSVFKKRKEKREERKVNK